MSTQACTFYPDLLSEAIVPARGIHSQTLSNGAGVELVLFGFAPGEALSEHTSARPAIIHILSGAADLTAGQEVHSATPGSWLRIPAGLTHSVRARTRLVMALYLLPAGGEDRGA
jgi:quercetin dioxygenase-like cupin family protein